MLLGDLDRMGAIGRGGVGTPRSPRQFRLGDEDRGRPSMMARSGLREIGAQARQQARQATQLGRGACRQAQDAVPRSRASAASSDSGALSLVLRHRPAGASRRSPRPWSGRNCADRPGWGPAAPCAAHPRRRPRLGAWPDARLDGGLATASKRALQAHQPDRHIAEAADVLAPQIAEMARCRGEQIEADGFQAIDGHRGGDVPRRCRRSGHRRDRSLREAPGAARSMAACGVAVKARSRAASCAGVIGSESGQADDFQSVQGTVPRRVADPLRPPAYRAGLHSRQPGAAGSPPRSRRRAAAACRASGQPSARGLLRLCLPASGRPRNAGPAGNTDCARNRT